MSSARKFLLYLIYFAAIIVLGSFILTSSRAGESPSTKTAQTIKQKPHPTVATTEKAGSTVPKAVTAPAPSKPKPTTPAPSQAAAPKPAATSSSSSNNGSSSGASTAKNSGSTESSSNSTATSPAAGEATTAATKPLANTGPGNVISLFGLVSLAGALIWRRHLITAAKNR